MTRNAFDHPDRSIKHSSAGTYTLRAARQARRKSPAYTKPVLVKSATYDKATRTVTLTLGGKAAPRDPLQLMVRDVPGLTHDAGNRLGGDLVIHPL